MRTVIDTDGDRWSEVGPDSFKCMASGLESLPAKSFARLEGDYGPLTVEGESLSSQGLRVVKDSEGDWWEEMSDGEFRIVTDGGHPARTLKYVDAMFGPLKVFRQVES